MELIKYCDNNKILLAIFPPHSTHTLQPLDVGMFKPLSTGYTKILNEFIVRTHSKVPIYKRTFRPLFVKAWSSSFRKELVLSAFEATGVWPMDRDRIVEKFRKKKERALSKQQIRTAILAERDWREMESLVRSTLKDGAEKQAEVLLRGLHHLHVQNKLLSNENLSLREAITVQKKLSKKSKPLNLQEGEDYTGGAIIYSPRKVKEARTRAAQKERDERDQQLQKAWRKEEREASARYNKLIAEEKRAQREAAQNDRARKKAEEAEQAAERRRRKDAQEQAQKDAATAAKGIQLSQRGKRAASQSRARNNKRAKSGGAAGSGEVGGGAAPLPPPKTTRHGRNVNLPSKFR
jgi:hypothetical protein